MIYFLATTESGPIQFHDTVSLDGDFIKIGSSGNPATRLQYQRIQYRRKDLELLGMMPGGVLAEKRLHRRFQHLQVKYELGTRGCWKAGRVQKIEWFYRSDEILNYIREHAVQEFPSKELVPVDFRVPDSFLMRVEFAAQRRHVSVDQYIEEALKERLRKDSL